MDKRVASIKRLVLAKVELQGPIEGSNVDVEFVDINVMIGRGVRVGMYGVIFVEVMETLHEVEELSALEESGVGNSNLLLTERNLLVGIDEEISVSTGEEAVDIKVLEMNGCSG